MRDLQSYSEPCLTLAYSEPWYIQNNQKHIQNPVKYLGWSILRKQLTSIIILANYFRKISFLRSLLYEINIVIFLNAGLIFTPEVFIVRKKVWEPTGPGVVNFDIPFLNKHAGTRKLGKLNKPAKCVNAKLTKLSLSNYEFQLGTGISGIIPSRSEIFILYPDTCNFFCFGTISLILKCEKLMQRSAISNKAAD